jgi:hypothetical protein
MPVPRQELSKAQGAGAVRGAQKHGVSVATRDELGAAKDERAHDDLADLVLELKHAKHLLAVENEDLSVLLGADAYECRPTREEIGLPGELTAPNDLDDRFGVMRHAQDRQRAAHDHEASRVVIARLHQRLTALHRMS